jgi:S-methylmethionine-dependent homocysteine/selenocysteine methylase
MTYNNLIALVSRYRNHIRNQNAEFIKQRRYGVMENTRVGNTDLLTIKMLDKILQGNILKSLTEDISLPCWIDQTQLDKIVSTVKTKMRHDQ